MPGGQRGHLGGRKAGRSGAPSTESRIPPLRSSNSSIASPPLAWWRRRTVHVLTLPVKPDRLKHQLGMGFRSWTRQKPRIQAVVGLSMRRRRPPDGDLRRRTAVVTCRVGRVGVRQRNERKRSTEHRPIAGSGVSIMHTRKTRDRRRLLSVGIGSMHDDRGSGLPVGLSPTGGRTVPTGSRVRSGRISVDSVAVGT